MQTGSLDLRDLARSGFEALGRGDARKAREHFEAIVASGRADAATCLALARACRSLQDPDAAHAAVDRALGLEPRNLFALVQKADHLAAAGDERGACAFYLHAVKIAPAPHEMPAELRGEITRAKALCDRYAAQFETYLRESVSGEAHSLRFAQSLDLMVGKRQIYLQEPRYYYFPELPQVQFYDRAGFPWLDRVEAATGEIRAELEAVLEDRDAFQPYVQQDPGRPRKDDGMLDNPAWSAFYLLKHGEATPNAARCPRTIAALADVPFPHVKNRSPSVLFSLLRPGAHIPPHNGFVNTRLICHLPLIVPGKCHFRVGNEVREWVEGKAWVFDDTIEHEAWNRSGETRVILLFETWRPELSEAERRLVTRMFEAIDARGTGERAAWEI